MNSDMAIDIVFDSFTRHSRGAAEPFEKRDLPACADVPALRVALRYGEQIRAPDKTKGLRILSGMAWVSVDGKDHILREGDCLEISGARGGAIISPLREGEILCEIS